MRFTKASILILLSLFTAGLRGESDNRQPHLGYIYPAGGRTGTTFKITAGGEFLRDAKLIHITGTGVKATVVQYVRAMTRKELGELRRRVTDIRRSRSPFAGQFRPRLNDINKPADNEVIVLPDNPLLEDLNDMTQAELQNLLAEFNNPKKQPNMQIAESVIIEIKIAPDAAPGDRELRIITPAGMTNPLCFQVGTLPEIYEPNFKELAKGPTSPAVPPIVLNGQVKPGDVDRFRFRAKKGQHLVMQTQARKLIPYLADAVPGWFQATLALYDANDRELAFTDDYKFDPDPVLFYEVPRDGEYKIEIRDAIYRGREDFVYRVTISEDPFITRIFPLGGLAGVKTVTSIAGHNVVKRELLLDTSTSGESVRVASLDQFKRRSNLIRYAVDNLPECNDIEINDSDANAQPVSLPVIVNGRIEKPGDMDVYRFQGHANQQVVAEVYARRLHSPLDSLLRLTDSKGKVLKFSDDYDIGKLGLLTHNADSYLLANLPADGTYYIRLLDSQHHGGKDFAYRLRISEPEPDFSLYASPSSINVMAGRTAAFCVQVLSIDGFKGPIELSLKNAPPGFSLGGAIIPADHNCVWMTLTAPDKRFNKPVVLELEGRAQIAGKQVTHPVIPCEDMMQAFAYRHLVTSQQLLAWVLDSKRFVPTFQLIGSPSVKIAKGSSTKVTVESKKAMLTPDITLKMSHGPKGLALENFVSSWGQVSFDLKADPNLLPAGFKDNIIIEASSDIVRGKMKKKQHVSLGVLPALSVEIVPK
jgi:hypothetical protein